MQVKTTHTEQVWQSPDGKRKIWQVTLKDETGNEYQLKTYSEEIGKLGFTGEVKSYVNRYGERFVRQLLPERSAGGSGYQRDDNAIRAQWAIGQAINLAAVKMDKDEITLPVIEKYAKQLFATVSRVKGESLTPAMQKEADQEIERLTQQTAGAF